jgi:hypothetical protein
MKKTLLIIAVAMTGHSLTSLGQTGTNCAQTLRLAQSVYEQGRLHELEGLLKECLARNGFTDQEKVNAYKLLTLTYIYLEEPVKADESMLSLLRTDTEFKINDNVDPAEFVALYKTFRTDPIYRVGLKLGSIASQPTVVSADYANDGESEYKYNFGFVAAVTFEIPLAGKLKKFTLAPELAFHIRSFTGTNINADTVLETTTRETQNWLTLPVQLQYELFENEKKITKAYVAAGISGEFLLGASKTLESIRGDQNSPVEEKSVDVSSQRNKFNTSILVSAGYKRKIGKGFLVAEVRYQMGLLPMLTKADTYENISLVTDYKNVDAIYKLNCLSLSVGYVLNRYNPKKIFSKAP